MIVKLIEVTNQFNWGKFMLQKFDVELSVRSEIDQLPLIRARGWTPDHIWVLDLQTGEGACFRPGGLPSADLNKHQVWVCPMFEPFLNWLYLQDTSDIMKLPALVEFTREETIKHEALSGYRRPGPDAGTRKQAAAQTKVKRGKRSK